LLNQSNMRYILLSYKKKTIVLSNEKLQLLFLKNLENLIYITNKQKWKYFESKNKICQTIGEIVFLYSEIVLIYIMKGPTLEILSKQVNFKIVCIYPSINKIINNCIAKRKLKKFNREVSFKLPGNINLIDYETL